ncbi:MAG: fasciclin domain-containing protein [Saprospiraceae bacterium]|nr:fasciclin domain-containing protein [Saprospiraceae bacterium]
MVRKLLSLCAALFILIQTVTAQSNLYDLIKASPEHRILSLLIDLYGYDDDLINSPVPLTIYAPTDAAFTTLGPYKLISILSNPEEEIGALLGRHVVIGKFTAANIMDGQQMLTITSELLTVGLTNGVYTVNGVEVITADIPASNGVLNIVHEFINPTATGNTIADIITTSPDHQAIASILSTSGLEDDLRGEGPFTVFAPTDAAINALDPLFVQELLADQAGKLRSLLLYHITFGNFTSSSLTNNQEILMSNGQRVTITFDGDIMMVNNIPVTVKDIIADNGVVHSIDTVLIPELDESNTILDIVARSPQHTILFASIALNGLDESLRSEGPITLFAPTNAAFEAMPQGLIEDILLGGNSAKVLLRHITNGKVYSDSLEDFSSIVMLDGSEFIIYRNQDKLSIAEIIGGDLVYPLANITVKDIEADNGIVHVIDAVISPIQNYTLYQSLVQSSNHRILQGLVNLLGMKEDLDSPDASLTLFAPTDDAFSKLPQEVIDTILNSDLDQVATILGYHVVPTPLSLSELTEGFSFKSITNADLRVYKFGNVTYINNAKIIQGDILTNNGILHVLDDVILTPDVVGLKVLSQRDGKIFPNPVSDQLNYDFTGYLSGDLTLELLDATGKRIGTYKQAPQGYISTAGLETGVYQLRVTDQSSLLTKPFIVVR